MSLLADETVSSFETENMQSDNESQRDGEEESGRNNVCVCVCLCGLYFTSVDADMCERHQGSASYHGS